MKSKLAPVILVIIILVAIGFIAKSLKPKTYTYSMTLVDVKAKKIFKKKIFTRKPIEYPTTSPYTKGKNTYSVYKCEKCGTIFAFVPYVPKGPADVMSMDPEAYIPKCPNCGSLADIIVPQIPEGAKDIDVQGEITIVRPTVK